MTDKPRSILLWKPLEQQGRIAEENLKQSCADSVFDSESFTKGGTY